MSTQIQRRRGTTAEHSTFTGVEGELTVDTTKDTAVVHDGTTVGGHPLQKQYPPLGSAAAPTYTFTGDTNTGIYSPGADQVAVATNGTGRLFINSTGDIQVGAASTLNGAVLSATADPASKNLYLAFNGTTTGADFLMGGISANANGTNIGTVDIYRGSSDNHGYISFRTKNGTTLGERLRITSAGLVGIGTSSPSEALHVKSTSGTQLVLERDGTTTQIASVVFKDGSGDQNRISSSDSNLIFESGAGNTERLRIDSSGRVGIGTTSPLAPFHVGSIASNTYALFDDGTNARITFNGSTSTAGIYSTTTGFASYEDLEIRAAATIFKRDGTNESARLDSSGRLLVGTSSAINASYAGGSIQLRDNAGGTVVFKRNDGVSTNGLGILEFHSSFGRAALIEVANDGTHTGSSTPGVIKFQTTSPGTFNSPTERMRIDSSGRVGIGSTAPNTKLEIREDSAGSVVELVKLNNNAVIGSGKGVRLGFGLSDSPTASSRAYIEAVLDGSNKTYLAFATNNGSGVFERARLDGDGRLLVGTSSSYTGYNFQVEGTAYSSSGGTFKHNANSAATGAVIKLIKSRGTSVGSSTIVQNDDRCGNIIFAGTDGSGDVTAASIEGFVDGTPGANDMPGRLVFSTTADGASSPTERWRIDSSGSLVGVAGSAFVAPYVYNTTTATAANVNVDASGFLRRSTSSIKYKTNVETIQDQYADAILGCRPVWYQSTCEADKPDWGHWGFIAEEVAEIDPRLCFFKEEEEDGTLEPEGVQYDRFVPHLLNLIKRQGEAIADLQAEVSALKGA
jgi:hypothetical protein